MLYGVIVVILPAIGFIDLLRKKPEPTKQQLPVTIIVPFRNKGKMVDDLIDSINRLNYPKDLFEVILVDDASADGNLSLLDQFNQDIDFQLIQNATHHGKKASILSAAKVAKYDIILTTDGDCRLPKDLLSNLSTDDLSVGVAIKTTSSWNVIENMQEVESLMLAGITLGTANMEFPMLAAGANLAYKKDLLALEPYEGNMHINSGDDMFLLKAAVEHGHKVAPRTGKPVTTSCEPSWGAYIEQGARWAGKNSDVNLLQTSLSAWLVLLANIVLPLSLITHFSSGWIILFIKFVVDFLFLFLSATYYERFRALLFAPVGFWFYPVHLVRVGLKIINSKRKKN